MGGSASVFNLETVALLITAIVSISGGVIASRAGIIGSRSNMYSTLSKRNEYLEAQHEKDNHYIFYLRDGILQLIDQLRDLCNTDPVFKPKSRKQYEEEGSGDE